MPANSTAAVVENLVPDATTTYRVMATGIKKPVAAGHRSLQDNGGSSTGSTNNASATTGDQDTSGWYKVSITDHMAQAYAGWEIGSDGLTVLPQYQDKWLYASSWQDAVWTAINGSAVVYVTDHEAGHSPGDLVTHNFPNGGDFKVGTGADISSRGGVEDFKLPKDDDQKLITLEDSYGAIDRDYDDFFWKVDVIKSSGDLIALTDHAVKTGVSHHYAITYWINALPVSTGTEQTLAAFTAVHPSAVLQDEIELNPLNPNGSSVGPGRNYLWDGWKSDGAGGFTLATGYVLGIIYHYGFGQGQMSGIENIMPIYTSPDSSQTRSYWDAVVTAAGNYKYAEQSSALSAHKSVRFPFSQYGGLANNSNTFIRSIVSQAGLTMTEMAGNHLGNDTPQPMASWNDIMNDQTWLEGTTPQPQP